MLTLERHQLILDLIGSFITVVMIGLLKKRKIESWIVHKEWTNVHPLCTIGLILDE
ncbi:hypothetical protein [Bacillus sp. CGMCC 1.16541]|uniref:hypothetical protein n=1 Tax=Bacillus sp. CGMCC 1.16541 TaxID=2185143 RepID=UPI0013A58C4C|nr:hypothetical protein [Bacillus sp. CGMCC 1.16541]